MRFSSIDMHTFLLSIGSNTYSERNVAKAKKALEQCFQGIVFTPTYWSDPYGEKYKRRFLNMLAKANTHASSQLICQKMKDLEKELGRIPADKEKGRVVIDMDLIEYDGEILRPKDYERSYVRELLDKF